MNAHSKLDVDLSKISFLYQAIFSTLSNGSREAFAYEALCRGEYYSATNSADSLIKLVSFFGMIKDLDAHTLTTNINKLKKNRELTISVNLSSYGITDKTVMNLLKENRLISPNLIIEITETERLDKSELDILSKNVKALKDIGYRFAIDDFGDGYSSIRYILKLPVDYVKISRATLKDVMQIDSGNKKILLKQMISAIKNHGIFVVIEGIETETEFQIAKHLGGDYFQGYLFDKPSLMENK